LQFVRFADDCAIYIKSKRAGDRVKESITRFISRKLKLKVNETKSSVIQPGYSKYLGFGFTHHKAAPKTKLRKLRGFGLPDPLARPLAATRKGA